MPRKILSECESDHHGQQHFVTTPLLPVTQSEATYALRESTELLWSHQEVWFCLPAFLSLHSGRRDNLPFPSGGWPEPMHAFSDTSDFSSFSEATSLLPGSRLLPPCQSQKNVFLSSPSPSCGSCRYGQPPCFVTFLLKNNKTVLKLKKKKHYS